MKIALNISWGWPYKAAKAQGCPVIVYWRAEIFVKG